MNDPKTRMRRGMAQILGELETLFSRDEIGAVQINIALRSGGVRTLKVYDDGFKILLIAAAAIGQREAFDAVTVDPEPDNWTEPPLSGSDANPGPVNCMHVLRREGKAYPRTCERCRLGPCPFYNNDGSAKA